MTDDDKNHVLLMLDFSTSNIQLKSKSSRDSVIKSKKESRYFGWNHDVIWSNNPDFTVNKTFSEDEKCKECIISSFPKRPGPIQGREKREGRCNIHPNLLIPVQCGKILVSLAYEITWPCKDTFSSKVLADSIGAMRQSEFVPVTILFFFF